MPTCVEMRMHWLHSIVRVPNKEGDERKTANAKITAPPKSKTHSN